MEVDIRQRKKLLENESRHSQVDHQVAIDEWKIPTQAAMSEQEYARNIIRSTQPDFCAALNAIHYTVKLRSHNKIACTS
jgi:hypothetical protein